MNLLIDIGNTWVKIALHDNTRIVKQFRYLTDQDKQIIDCLNRYEVNNGIFTTTANISSGLSEYFFSRRILELNHTFHFPFKISYKTPETLGRDRISAISGAYHLFPNQDCLVIDAGTCITYDLLTANGIYVGGNIAPGLQMRSRSMATFTDKLPEVNVLEWKHSKIGESTIDALQNGAVFGALLEIEGYIAHFQSRYNKLNTILTGGDAHFLHEKINSRIFVHPEIVFQGLYQILKHNA